LQSLTPATAIIPYARADRKGRTIHPRSKVLDYVLRKIIYYNIYIDIIDIYIPQIMNGCKLLKAKGLSEVNGE